MTYSKSIASAAVLFASALSGCEMTSNIADAGNGTYSISASATEIRGGASEAHSLAYEAAGKFCAKYGLRAVVIDANERAAYRGSAGRSRGYAFDSGDINLRFRCDR